MNREKYAVLQMTLDDIDALDVALEDAASNYWKHEIPNLSPEGVEQDGFGPDVRFPWNSVLGYEGNDKYLNTLKGLSQRINSKRERVMFPEEG